MTKISLHFFQQIIQIELQKAFIRTYCRRRWKVVKWNLYSSMVHTNVTKWKQVMQMHDAYKSTTTTSCIHYVSVDGKLEMKMSFRSYFYTALVCPFGTIPWREFGGKWGVVWLDADKFDREHFWQEIVEQISSRRMLVSSLTQTCSL